MRTTPFLKTGSLFANLILLTATLTAADGLARYEAQPGSKVKIEGTSTVHNWTVEGAIIGGALELDPAFDFQKPTPGKVNAKVQATIPVRSIKSGKKAMDDVMHDAMKQKDFPKIEYRLTELTLKEAPKSADAPLVFDSKGELTVSGVTNKITMPVTMQRVDKTQLKTTGNLAVKMTAYGIQPPAPKIALGFITTGDDVKITFEWLTASPEK